MPSAWQEFRLLLALRLRTAWNSTRFAPPQHRLIGGVLSFGSLALFVAIWVAYAALLSTTRQQSPALFSALIERTVFFLFLFLLAGGIPFVSGVLLAPGDLPLLAVSPVRPAVVVAARLLDAIGVSSGQFLVIGVPLLMAAASALRLDFGGWLLFLLLLLLFLALPALLVAALLLALARLVGVRHLRTAVAITSALLSLVMCLLTVREVSARASSSGLVTQAAGQTSIAALPVDHEPPPDWMPSTWAGDALLGLSNGQAEPVIEGFVLLLCLALVATGICLILGGSVLVGERLLELDGGAGRGPGRPSLLDRTLRLLPLAAPIRALIAKDLRYVVRDLVLLSQIGIPVILYLVPFVIAGQVAGTGSGNTSGSSDLLLLSLGIVGTIVYMETSILGLSSVGLEGRAFWLVLIAPVSSGQLVRAKFLFAFLSSLAIGAPLYLASCLFFKAGMSWTLGGFAVLLFACAALCGLGVGIAGIFPRFVYDNPAHRASLAALIWGFVAATVYLLLAGALLGGGFFAATQWPERGAAFIGGGVVLFLTLSLAATFLPLMAARARLEGYAWEE
jgi:ABC-2 type transport system permease protein